VLRQLTLALLLAAPVAAAAAPDPFDQSGVPIEQLPTDPTLAKIVLIAGFPATTKKSGEHEYFAGVALLAKKLKQTPGVHAVVGKGGWPKKAETLPGAKAVVLFLEGGDANTVIKGDHIKELMKLEGEGAGIVHLHSAIDYPKDFTERIRAAAGGVWQKGPGKRAHWVGEFKDFPDHAIFRGVTPFSIDDGWLWVNSFAEGRKGVMPLLRTKSPKDAGKTTDDDAVIAWAFDRANGGKSFTFTGGHLHESLSKEGYRRFLVNGILWSAGRDIPKVGAPVKLAPAEMNANLDKKPAPKKK